MALKDLVADQDKLNEESIEGIISPYLRYDPSAFSIVFTPVGASLSNEARLLVYLVAICGWRYVVPDPQKVDTKPADLEEVLNIPGGSLRPLLKKLKDSHLIKSEDGHYIVQIANLNAIKDQIGGGNGKSIPGRKTRTNTRKAQGGNSNSNANAATGDKQKKRPDTGSLKELLNEWIAEGFFDEPKTISDLLNRYHEYGVITKTSSLSGLLLRAVQDRLLVRKKDDTDSKVGWLYQVKKS